MAPHNRLEFRAWCAWQESNLLPHAPQACALSGELQARKDGSRGRAWIIQPTRELLLGTRAGLRLAPLATTCLADQRVVNLDSEVHQMFCSTFGVPWPRNSCGCDLLLQPFSLASGQGREPGPRDRRSRRGRCQEADQRFGCVPLFDHSRDRRRKEGFFLQLGRDSADE